jgi:hypothetical protein
MSRGIGSVALLLACGGGLLAQVNKSNLSGVVRDPTGAAIVGTAVRATNTGTGATRQELTDATGLYRFALLDHGTYRVDAETPGFKRFSRDNVLLQTGETISVDITLEVGAVTDAVTVTGDATLLRTETASLGNTVNATALNELPLIGRNPYVFLTLSPGIQYFGDPGALNPWDVFGPADFAANGSEARSEFLLDGIPNMRIDVVSFSPSPDSVQEMRVQTNTYDAEYGHSGAAFVNVSTMSGTNKVHGSVYWFHRNDNLNANSFFNNLTGTRKNESKQNTYGFAVSGPAWIPKLYNGKNKTHYFFDFEGTQIRGAGTARAIVPSNLERGGNFSQSLDRAGALFQIYDPITTRPAGGGAFVRDLFPGNIIPASRQDKVALNAMKFYPLPNRVPTVDLLQNFESNQPGGRRWASLTGRVDHQITNNQQLFFRYGWNHRLDPSTPVYGECCRAAGNPTDGQDEFARGNIAGATGYTWVLNNRTVFDFRFGFTRYYEANIMFGEGFDISTLGFPNSFAKSIAFATFPRFEMSGDVSNLGAGRVTTKNYINQYNPLVNFHTAMGRHALKYGFRYQIAQQNDFAPNRSAGFFRFDRVLTRGPDPNRATTTGGHDVASFLLGTATRGYTDMAASRTIMNTYYAFYLHDDWKATDRLTLNLGLRFEHEDPVKERFDRGSAGYEFGVASPLESAAQANYARSRIPELATLNVRGGLRFLNTGGAPRGHLDMPKMLYAPRLGFAYRLNNWMVARGGWGVFYVPNNVSNFRQDGFSLATQMVTSLDNNLTPYRYLADPFPAGLTNPPGAAEGLLTGVGQALTAGRAVSDGVPSYRHGLNQQFSMGFQFALPGKVSVETSYAGTVSQRLNMTRNINQYPDQYLALGNRLNAQVANPFLGVITNPTSALALPTITVSQLLRPLPHFTGFTESTLPYGRAHYDSLQINVGRRMSHGLQFGAGYTVSKFLESTSWLNPNDPKPEKVISDSDRPQRFVIYGIWELPFGRNKAFFTNAPRIVDYAFGGWQLSWIGTYQSSAPLGFAAAERVSRSSNNPHTLLQWFDVSQFVQREPFQLARTSSRIADLRGDGMKKWDVTLSKRFAITESVKFGFRAEFYNALNTTMFGNPNTTITSASFGRVTGTLAGGGSRNVQLSGRVEF